MDLLFEEITNIYQEKKYEAIYFYKNAYRFEKIIDTLSLQSVCQNEETLPPLYIQEPQKE